MARYSRDVRQTDKTDRRRAGEDAESVVFGLESPDGTFLQDSTALDAVDLSDLGAELGTDAVFLGVLAGASVSPGPPPPGGGSGGGSGGSASVVVAVVVVMVLLVVAVVASYAMWKKRRLRSVPVASAKPGDGRQRVGTNHGMINNPAFGGGKTRGGGLDPQSLFGSPTEDAEDPADRDRHASFSDYLQPGQAHPGYAQPLSPEYAYTEPTAASPAYAVPLGQRGGDYGSLQPDHATYTGGGGQHYRSLDGQHATYQGADGQYYRSLDGQHATYVQQQGYTALGTEHKQYTQAGRGEPLYYSSIHDDGRRRASKRKGASSAATPGPALPAYAVPFESSAEYAAPGCVDAADGQGDYAMFNSASTFI